MSHFQALRGVEPGFTQPEYVQTFGISYSGERGSRCPTHDAHAAEVLDPPRHHSMRPRRWRSRRGCRRTRPIDGAPRSPPKANRRWPDAANRQVKLISPGMFQTLGTPLVAGRDFHVGPTSMTCATSRSCRRTWQREFWGSPARAVQRVREYYAPRTDLAQVIGVAGDVHDTGVHSNRGDNLLARLTAGAAYQPRRVTSPPHRTRRARRAARRMHEAVWAGEPSLPLAQVRTLESVYDHRSLRPRSRWDGWRLQAQWRCCWAGAASTVRSRTRVAGGARLGIRCALVRRRTRPGVVRSARPVLAASVWRACRRSGLHAVECDRCFSASARSIRPRSRQCPSCLRRLPAGQLSAGARAMAVDPVETMMAE